MKQLISVKRSTQALLVVCMALSLIVVIELLGSARIEGSESIVSGQGAAELPSISEAVYLPPRLDDMTEILDRPLFFADRKMPPEPKPGTEPVAPPTPLRLTLEGVAITSESRIAVLRNLNNNQLLQLEEGMSHEGWTLDGVTASGVSFKRGAQVADLTLDPDTANRQRR